MFISYLILNWGGDKMLGDVKALASKPTALSSIARRRKQTHQVVLSIYATYIHTNKNNKQQ